MLENPPEHLVDHVSIGTLTRIIPRYIVDDALHRTNAKEKRSRLLPAHVVVYFIIALNIFTDGYEEVIRKLVNGLRFSRTWSYEWNVPTTSALTQARTRLGEAPMRELFRQVAVPVAKPSTPGGFLGHLRVMAIDGVMIDLPDTPTNCADYPKAQNAPFPQTRVLGLAEAGTHAIIDIAIGSLHDGERALTERLLATIDDDMLITADRGFYSYDLWRLFHQHHIPLLWRIPSTPTLPVLQILPDGSYLSEITNQRRGSKTRIDAHNVTDISLATHIQVRVIEYTITGTTNDNTPETFRLLTTLTDPHQHTADQLARTYHERWEIETAFREIETYLRAGKGIRAKSPELARQEIWGLFLAHYAIRAFMTEAADTVEMDPDRLSFTRTLNIVRRRITDPAEFSPRKTTTKPPP